MDTHQNRIYIFILAFSTILSSCEKNTSLDKQYDYTYKVPELKNDGWEVTGISDVGIDEDAIEDLTKRIGAEQYKGIHSLLIVKNGFLVYEEYFENYSEEDLQFIFSITKSVTSSLIGIAIENGQINSIQNPILSYFPEYEINDSTKQTLQLKHFLSLTTGFEWDEKTYSYTDPLNSEYQMIQTDDWIEFVLQRPLIQNPGEKFVYNTGAVHVLSGVIEKATGLFADKFAEQVLFEPLGINEYDWNKDPNGYPCTGATLQGLKLKARDAAKFGFLYLNNGKWKNEQIIPEYWVNESTKAKIEIENERYYGYLWFVGHFEVQGERISHFYTAGFGGQSIFIVPSLNLMIVFLCWNNPRDADIFFPIITILNAII